MKNKFYLMCLITFPFTASAQNTCATALVAPAGSYTITVIDGSEAPLLACAAGGTGSTMAEWYKYTPTMNYTVTVSSDVVGNTPDTRVHVFLGTCGAYTCHSGDDDGGTGTLSSCTFDVVGGTDYYIVWDNRYSAGGFDFTITEAPFVAPILPPVTFSAASYPSITGSYGLALVDMNGDFLDDIVTVSNTSIQIQYQQASGLFSAVNYTTSSAANDPSWSLAVGDIDKNGFNDLMYGGGNGVTFMKANNTGTGYTQMVTGTDYVFCQRTNFTDLNNDGDLDAFSCHDVDPNVYYLNDGSGNLTFYQGGIGDHDEGGNYGSVWVDYDNDGDSDLFIAKCRGGSSTAKINELHRNDGAGVFTDVSIVSNMADALQTWSAAWNDYDNDGDMDALIGASSSADGTHKFMINNGDGTFTDATAGTGWESNTSLSIEHCTYDFDNDGFTDVMGGGNKIMFNNGDLTWSPTDYAFGSGAIGDMNNDGFLDVRNGNTIHYNNGNDNNWVKINLQGVQSNGNGIGARIEIYGDWGKQIRDVRSGEGFRYMSTLNTHFGIGTATEIVSILVKWPSGHVDNIISPSINSSVVVVEGSSPLSVVELEGKKVTLYPNPTTNFVTIDNIDLLNVENMSVVSYNGAEVIRVSGSTSKLDVSKLNPGLYILTISTKDGMKYSESFIKQ